MVSRATDLGFLQTIEVQACVKYYPRNQEAGERRHESLLHQLPDATVRFLVDLLEIDAVHVDDAAVDGRESVRQNLLYERCWSANGIVQHLQS